MINRINLSHAFNPSQSYFTLPFGNLQSGKAAPKWGMSLLAAGSMRFRWNEKNPNRDEFFKTLSSAHLIPVPVQLDHTRTVYDVKSPSDTFGKIGDGIITKNKSLIPTVTAADCMPIFLFDPVTEVFGIVHSGWKGTGIVGDAINLAEKNYGAKARDFRVAIGPHIRDCCYIVDEKRAKYFTENFCADCVKKIENGEPRPKFAWNNGNGSLYRLSLEKANLSVLEKIGVREENITVCEDCTACNTIYGSNRRETASANLPKGETQSAAPTPTNRNLINRVPNSANGNTAQHFTPMASFVLW